MIHGEIPDDVWFKAQQWGALTGTPEEDLVAELLRRALWSVHPIPVGPPAAWMRRLKECGSGRPRIAVAALSGPRWNEFDERLGRIPGAERLLGQSSRLWYTMPYTHLDMIRTLFADAPDRIRVCEFAPQAP